MTGGYLHAAGATPSMEAQISPPTADYTPACPGSCLLILHLLCIGSLSTLHPPPLEKPRLFPFLDLLWLMRFWCDVSQTPDQVTKLYSVITHEPVQFSLLAVKTNKTALLDVLKKTHDHL